LLALLAGLFLFVGPSLHCNEESWKLKTLPLLLFISLLLVWLNRKPKQSLRQVKYILRIIAHDISYFFHRPILGGGFAFSGLAVMIGILILAPRLYSKAQPAIPGNGTLPSLGVRAPCNEKTTNLNDNFSLIAGGLKDIGYGQTAQGFHWIGATVPQIFIIEYSDYECPYCRKAHEIVREVVREHKDKVRLVHIQMPLDHKCNPVLRRPFHRHACKCALAAICAAEQSAFWPMNDQLFIQRGNFDFNGLIDLVTVMGLDQDRFKHCMAAKKARHILALNLAECIKHKIKPATPTFAIGGKIVMGLKNKAWWLRAIEHFEHKPNDRKSQQVTVQ
jgi:predicted DsbA family dithiol-disulfide isomerase